MPELPEVEITKRKLITRKILGAKISSFWSDWPRGLKITPSAAAINRDIRGRKILSLERIGKVLFLNLSGKVPQKMAFHFRMSGRLIVGDYKDYKSDKAIHYRIKLRDRREIMFRDPRKFGVIWYGTAEQMKKDPYLGTLGPDMLQVTLIQFKERLSQHRGMIKPVLLNQKSISGIGNIIVDEALWHSRIHPRTAITKLKAKDIHRLFKSLKFIIQRIIKAKGSSFRDWMHLDGAGGYRKIRFVYARRGEKCPRCKSKIERIVIGSRGTSLCSKCQTY